MVAAGVALAISASIAALRQCNRIVALELRSDGRLAARAGNGAEAPIVKLSYRIVAGAGLIIHMRVEGRRFGQLLVLVPGDQSSSDLRALRTHLRLRRPGAVSPARLFTAPSL